MAEPYISGGVTLIITSLTGLTHVIFTLLMSRVHANIIKHDKLETERILTIKSKVYKLKGTLMKD